MPISRILGARHMPKHRILVFPCGSEIGLEVYRSLRHSAHVELFGASSVSDHGEFVYEHYFGGLPFVDDPGLIPALREIVSRLGIHAIYPAMDKVIWKLKCHEEELGCKVIASSPVTTEICLSKSRTYQHLCDTVKVPKSYLTAEEVANYPVFVKPDIGYGTRGVYKAEDADELRAFLRKHQNTKHVICEYLPGPEYTIDCFTDRHGHLKFAGPRTRDRINNGISVRTVQVKDDVESFHAMAEKISSAIQFRGAWFFQAKRDRDGQLTLIEVASRFGGSSALHRALGVNFALLSVFDAFDVDVQIILNKYGVQSDRALDTRFRTTISFSTMYIDLDDTIIVDGQLNLEAVSLLYKCRNEGKKVVLITKHGGDLADELSRYRIASLFDQIIHLNPNQEKTEYINDKDAVFIDDSFAERLKVSVKFDIPVFDPCMIDALL
jgi:hypothetical protein